MKKNLKNITPLVTIGIPTYNRPVGLRHVLNCALEQTYQNIEIIIADNCSEPKLAVDEVIKNYSQDNRVVYFRHEKNIGPMNNFEFLLRKAKGKYFIWFPDDDNYDDSELIEKYVRVLESAPLASASMGSVEYIDGTGVAFLRDDPPYCLDGKQRERIWTYVATDITDHLMYGMLRTELIKNYKFEKNVHTTEKFFILYLLSKGPIIDCIDANYKNIYSFKTADDISKLLGKSFTRNHTLVWIGNAFRYMSIINAILLSSAYLFLKTPKLSWPLKKLFAIPKQHPGRTHFKIPYTKKLTNE